MALSGFMPEVEGFELDLTGLEGYPVAIAHGSLDPVIPVEFGRAAAERVRDGRRRPALARDPGAAHDRPATPAGAAGVRRRCGDRLSRRSPRHALGFHVLESSPGVHYRVQNLDEEPNAMRRIPAILALVLATAALSAGSALADDGVPGGKPVGNGPLAGPSRVIPVARAALPAFTLRGRQGRLAELNRGDRRSSMRGSRVASAENPSGRSPDSVQSRQGPSGERSTQGIAANCG